MENFTEQLKNAKNIRMTDTEKARMRETLISHMEKFPLAETTTTQIRSVPKTSTASPYSIPSVWSGAVFLRIAASALALVLLIGSSATFASANATPGSLLYPVRIHVKEKVERALITAPEKKLAYDQGRIETRISELETLADTTNPDDTDAVLTAKAAFTENLSDFQTTLKETESSGRLAVSVKTREQVLARLSAYADPVAPVMATMSLAAAKTAPETAAPTLMKTSVRMDTGASAEVEENQDTPLIPVTSSDKKEKNKLKESIHELLKVGREQILETAQRDGAASMEQQSPDVEPVTDTLSVNENTEATSENGTEATSTSNTNNEVPRSSNSTGTPKSTLEDSFKSTITASVNQSAPIHTVPR